MPEYTAESVCLETENATGRYHTVRHQPERTDIIFGIAKLYENSASGREHIETGVPEAANEAEFGSI